jgi:hypothetical protein
MNPLHQKKEIDKKKVNQYISGEAFYTPQEWKEIQRHEDLKREIWFSAWINSK